MSSRGSNEAKQRPNWNGYCRERKQQPGFAGDRVDQGTPQPWHCVTPRPNAWRSGADWESVSTQRYVDSRIREQVAPYALPPQTARVTPCPAPTAWASAMSVEHRRGAGPFDDTLGRGIGR